MSLRSKIKVQVPAVCLGAVLSGGCAGLFGPQVDDLGLYSYEDQMLPPPGTSTVGGNALSFTTYRPVPGPFGNFYGAYNPLICPPAVATPSIPVVPTDPPGPALGEDRDAGAARPIRRRPGGARFVVSRRSSAHVGSPPSGSRSSPPLSRPSAPRAPSSSASPAAQTVRR